MQTTYVDGNSPTPATDDTQAVYTGGEYQSNPQTDPGYGQRDEAEELFTHRIQGKRRTFFVDLKQSHQGRYLKLTEKSGGQKRTILMDEEDFPELMGALNQISDLLKN
jgi:PurA ssDNA and RNA-binding protein